MKKWIIYLCVVLFAFTGISNLMAGGASEADSSTGGKRIPVTIYTALEADQLEPYKNAIESDLTDVEIVWLRDSTGVITARLIAERENPKADMIMGVPTSSVETFKRMDMVEAYTPSGSENLKPLFKDKVNPMYWTGTDVFLTTIVANIPELEKAGVAIPTSWDDLLNPKLNNRIVMPNPNSSGTGYITLAAWIALWGEEGAWEYMDKLHKNISVYLHSGSRPVAGTAQGEYAVGIGSDLRAVREFSQGAPIKIVVPSEGTGWGMNSVALMANGPNSDAAKRVIDWTGSQQSHEIGAQFFGIVGHKDVNMSPENYPDALEEGMISDIDVVWMADNRDRILAEWAKRYDGKDEVE